MAREKRRRSPKKQRETNRGRQLLDREALDAAEYGGSGLQDAGVAKVTKLERTAVALQYEGPLPPPYMLREYDEAIPGAGERILCEAERQAEHRRAMESKLVEGTVSWNKRGQTFAFVVVLPGRTDRRDVLGGA